MAYQLPKVHDDSCPECCGNGHIGGDLQSPWACTIRQRIIQRDKILRPPTRRRIKMLGIAVPLVGLNISMMLDLFTGRDISQGSIILSGFWVALMLGSAYHDWRHHGSL